MTQDIRWHQRFNHLKKAFEQLKEAVEMGEDQSDLEQEGMIKRFEYTYEHAWNTIKDFLENQGYTSITGSRDAFREAFKAGLITEGEKWMDMITSRILTSHTYDEATADKISEDIREIYFFKFEELIERLNKDLSGQENIF